MTTSDPEAIERRKKELQSFYKALSDVPVGPSDPRYFPFEKAPGGARGTDVIAELRAGIQLDPSGARCQLFSGYRGSGKSSELLRMREELLRAGHEVVFVEGYKVVNLNKPLEATDLLVSVAAAVAEHVERAKGKSPATESLGQRILNFFRNTTVNLSEVSVGGSLGAAGMKLDVGKLAGELSTNPTFKSMVQDALRGGITRVTSEFQDFMAAARHLLAIPPGGPSPVLIVDDLEKVRGSGAEQDAVQQSMEQVFWEYHHELHVQGWHTIWTAPPYVQMLNGDIASEYDGLVVLPMVRVWENDDDRTLDRAGVNAVRACLGKRGDAASFFRSDELFDRLVLASSGHLRVAIRLMRDVVRTTSMQADPTVPMNEPAVDRLIRNYAGECRKAIYREDLSWLAAVAERRTLEGTLDSKVMVPRAAKLLDTAVVMTYRNGVQWVDVCYAARDMR